MSYSTLMVHLDLGQSNEIRLQRAGELAERFDSRLIGVAAADIQPLYFAEGGVAEDLLEKDRAHSFRRYRRILLAQKIQRLVIKKLNRTRVGVLSRISDEG